MALAVDIVGLGLPVELASLLGLSQPNTIAGVGTAQSGGAAIPNGATQVLGTTASSQTAFVLPSDAPLNVNYVFTNTSATAALLYPPLGGFLNTGAVNTSITLAQYDSVFVQRRSTNYWIAVLTTSPSILSATNTFTGPNTFSGVITPSGGIASALSTMSPRLWYTGGQAALTTTTPGTDTTPSVTETYLAELFVGSTISSTGVSLFNGSAAAGNVTLYLSNAASTNLANTASTAQSGTAAYQQVAWAGGPITILGPATYFILLQCNNTSARFRSHAIGNIAAGKLTSTTYGTFPTSFSAPTTFTASLGPIAGLY